MKMQVTVRVRYPMVLGLSSVRKGSLSDKLNSQEKAMNLFPSVVHQLIVRTTEYFPVTREGRMRYDEVTRRITISISYFGVMDTGTISRGGLGADKSIIR